VYNKLVGQKTYLTLGESSYPLSSQGRQTGKILQVKKKQIDNFYQGFGYRLVCKLIS